jgi:cell volume regulation protein A
VAARGQTVLMPGDHIYVFVRIEDRALVQLLFGRPESR